MTLNTGERVEGGTVKDADGRTVVSLTARSPIKLALISMATAADNVVVAAVAGKRLSVLNYIAVAAGATTVQVSGHVAYIEDV